MGDRYLSDLVEHFDPVAVEDESRSVMWTGIHAVQNGMWDNTNMAWIDDLDPEKVRTVGHMLRDAGYYKAFKGKWHLSVITGNTRGTRWSRRVL